MTSKERVLAALNHKEPDRVPVDFGATAVTGIHVKIVGALRAHYGLARGPVKVHEPYQMLGLVEEDLKQALGVDINGVFPPETMFGFRNVNWKSFRMDDGTEVLVSELFKTTKDKNGDTLIYPKGDPGAPPAGRLPKDGFFFDSIIRQPPIVEDKLDPADNWEEFGPISEADLDYFDEATREAADSTRAVMANFGGTGIGDIALVPGPFLKNPKGIRDVEEWYVSTVTRPAYVHAIFEKQTDFVLANMAKLAARVGDRVHTVYICGTDFGTQLSTFCSVGTFRALYMPYYKKMNDWIHAHTAWKTFKHSCGAVETLIPSIIESGFDILNPVQVSAAGMDAEKLKAKYGRDVVFWGGGIDTQKTLMFGRPDQVRAEVFERCRIFGKGGGFIFNAIHNIQANVPVPNVIALFDALREVNG
jgi:uroporphyrinogen-III decarboxylase